MSQGNTHPPRLTPRQKAILRIVRRLKQPTARQIELALKRGERRVRR